MITGFTCSCFDLLHAGHILMLEEAKLHCDRLIVGLQTDPTLDRPEKNAPIQSVTERYIQLAAVKYVDEIIPYENEEDLINLLKLKMPNIRFVGADYHGKPFTGDDLEIETFYNNRQHTFSSRELKNRVIHWSFEGKQ